MSTSNSRENIIQSLKLFSSVDEVRSFISVLSEEEFNVFVEIQKEFNLQIEKLIQDFIQKVVYEYYNENEVVIWTSGDGYKVIWLPDRIVTITPYLFTIHRNKSLIFSWNTSFIFSLDEKIDLLEKLVY